MHPLKALGIKLIGIAVIGCVFAFLGCSDIVRELEAQAERERRPQRVGTADGVTIWKMRKDDGQWLYFTTGSGATLPVPGFAERLEQ